MVEEIVVNIGDRCHLNEHKGTIKYIGEVPPTEGLWYGVEWDDERGKHDGRSKDGRQYFKCRDNYGSFVRPQKISFGIDEIQGLHKAYGDGGFDEAENKITLNKQTKQETFIEMVGFDKIARMQSNFDRLKDIDLVGLNIDHACLSNNLSKEAPNLRSLSLRDNLLTSLKQVFLIAGSLKYLERLNISENYFSDYDVNKDDVKNCFSSLKALYANKMKLTWPEVQKLMSISPKIEELYLCYNQITTVEYSTVFDNVVFLNLEGNQICKWDEVLKISAMKSIEKLILNENKIEDIFFKEERSTIFSKLNSISLCGNLLHSWNAINELSYLKCLDDIKFRSNPVSKDITNFVMRQEVIARLANLQSCNLSTVVPAERKTAESAYIKRYSEEFHTAKLKNIFHEFNNNHPRYMELVKVYGEPAVKQQTVNPLKDNLLELHFECPDFEGKPKLQKKLPATMTVQQLKGVLQRLYKIQNSKQNLSYVDKENDREITLEDNMKQLTYYSISSGDVIFIRW